MKFMVYRLRALAALCAGCALLLTGCPQGPQTVVGGTWLLSANYYQYPGPYLIAEEWPMVFRANGTVDLMVGATPFTGNYTFGTSESIVHISSHFMNGEYEFGQLSTTLTLRNGRLQGNFVANYSEWLQGVLEELNGIPAEYASGTLNGSRVKAVTEFDLKVALGDVSSRLGFESEAGSELSSTTIGGLAACAAATAR